jgi:hypothetical protein
MVMNGFGNGNFMQPMQRLSTHSTCLDFFSFKFWVGWGQGRGFCSLSLSQQVPNRFSIFLWVLNVFPKDVPNSTHFNPICFAQNPPLLTYIGSLAKIKKLDF